MAILCVGAMWTRPTASNDDDDDLSRNSTKRDAT